MLVLIFLPIVLAHTSCGALKHAYSVEGACCVNPNNSTTQVGCPSGCVAASTYDRRPNGTYGFVTPFGFTVYWIFNASHVSLNIPGVGMSLPSVEYVVKDGLITSQESKFFWSATRPGGAAWETYHISNFIYYLNADAVSYNNFDMHTFTEDVSERSDVVKLSPGSGGLFYTSYAGTENDVPGQITKFYGDYYAITNWPNATFVRYDTVL